MFQLSHRGSWQQAQRKMPAIEELDRKSESSSSQRKLCQCHRRRIKDFRKNPWKSDLSSQGSITIYWSDQIRRSPSQIFIMAMSVECCSSDRLMSVGVEWSPSVGASDCWVDQCCSSVGTPDQSEAGSLGSTSSPHSSQASTECNCANSLELGFDLDSELLPFSDYLPLLLEPITNVHQWLFISHTFSTFATFWTKTSFARCFLEEIFSAPISLVHHAISLPREFCLWQLTPLFQTISWKCFSDLLPLTVKLGLRWSNSQGFPDRSKREP